MAEIIPFKGIFYNKERVEAGDVVAPPYDVISPEMREELYAKSPFNVVRIDFGKEMEGDNDRNKYTRAAEYLRDWLEKGVFLRSAEPCFYAYRMDYLAAGEQRQVTGFFGLVRIEEFGHGIYPHEATHSKPRQDRLSLLKICRANTSPIFSLYDSASKIASEAIEKATEKEPYMKAADSDGAKHSFWLIDDPASIAAISADLEDKAIFIADGHHRYETALEYQRLMRAEKGIKSPRPAKETEPFDYVLMFLANISDGGLTVLPTHRLIEEKIEDIADKLSEEFEVDKLPEGSDISGAITGKEHTFGLYSEDGLYVLSYKGDRKGAALQTVHPALRGLDVVILEEVILKRLLGVSRTAYEMDARKAELWVREGRYGAAFFLNPTGINEVKEVASSSLRMPPKSTYFYPKLLTGFVINSLKD